MSFNRNFTAEYCWTAIVRSFLILFIQPKLILKLVNIRKLEKKSVLN